MKHFFFLNAFFAPLIMSWPAHVHRPHGRSRVPRYHRPNLQVGFVPDRSLCCSSGRPSRDFFAAAPPTARCAFGRSTRSSPLFRFARARALVNDADDAPPPAPRSRCTHSPVRRARGSAITLLSSDCALCLSQCTPKLCCRCARCQARSTAARLAACALTPQTHADAANAFSTEQRIERRRQRRHAAHCRRQSRHDVQDFAPGSFCASTCRGSVGAAR